MITTILAIYGAVVSTTAVLLSVWVFRASGPRLQAQATFQPHFRLQGEKDTGDRSLTVKVWNTGRHPIKVELDGGLTIRHRKSGHQAFIPMYWHGPDLPIWIPGQSGEEWWEEVPDLPGQLEEPNESNELLVELTEGGNRRREVKVSPSELRATLEDSVIYGASDHDSIPPQELGTRRPSAPLPGQVPCSDRPPRSSTSATAARDNEPGGSTPDPRWRHHRRTPWLMRGPQRRSLVNRCS
jgi:hypothetical protein